MMKRIFKNLRVVLPNAIMDDATIIVDQGIILDVKEAFRTTEGIDCHGAICVPGLIDTHSDAIETEAYPRAHVTFDTLFAVNAVENRFSSAGILTACHGVTYEDCEYRNRTIEGAKKLVSSISFHKQTAEQLIEHRLLLRLDVRSKNAYGEVVNLLKNKACISEKQNEIQLVSLEDHAPGEGAFKDLYKFKKYLSFMAKCEGEKLDQLFLCEIDKAKEGRKQREECLMGFSRYVKDYPIRLQMHDCLTAESVIEAYAAGVTVAEFPLTIEAATQARELGMFVVAGAPNVIRNGSHSGFVSAQDLIERKLCTSLASDYSPYSLIAAPFFLAKRKVLPLHEAIQLVTSEPAKILGINDCGRIEPGMKANLLFVTLHNEYPQILSRYYSSGQI